MKRMLSAEDVWKTYAKYGLKQVEEENERYVLTTRNNHKVIIPKYEYEFVRGETVPFFLLIADASWELVRCIHAITPVAATLRYTCLQFEEVDGRMTFTAVDPWDHDNLCTHILVRAEWSKYDRTDRLRVDLCRLKEQLEAVPVRSEIGDYGLSGVDEFILPVRTPPGRRSFDEFVDNHQVHIMDLIRMGDEYIEGFLEHRDEYKERIVKLADELCQSDPWCVDAVRDDDLILKHGTDCNKIPIRFEEVGLRKINALMNSN